MAAPGSIQLKKNIFFRIHDDFFKCIPYYDCHRTSVLLWCRLWFHNWFNVACYKKWKVLSMKFLWRPHKSLKLGQNTTALPCLCHMEKIRELQHILSLEGMLVKRKLSPYYVDSPLTILSKKIRHIKKEGRGSRRGNIRITVGKNSLYGLKYQKKFLSHSEILQE